MPALPNGAAVAAGRGLSRWVVYQRERFPLLGHGPLILAFASGAVCYSARLRAARGGGAPGVTLASVAVAFVSCLLFFFQLRVADEFKDFRDDARHRPYRPVPRGLVTLRELRALAVGGMGVQLALALALDARLLAPLALAWAYIALMTKEFWLRGWLATRPATVLWTHMLVMPCIDLYATACDWLPAGGAPGAGLAWFLLASFFNGMVVEVGRKVRAPADEERGVQTYSALWGRGRAAAVWLAVMAATGVCATLAAAHVGGGAARGVAVALGAVGALAAAAAVRLTLRPAPGAGKPLELIAGVWTLALYVGVGVVPYLAGR